MSGRGRTAPAVAVAELVSESDIVAVDYANVVLSTELQDTATTTVMPDAYTYRGLYILNTKEPSRSAQAQIITKWSSTTYVLHLKMKEYFTLSRVEAHKTITLSG